MDTHFAGTSCPQRVSLWGWHSMETGVAGTPEWTKWLFSHNPPVEGPFCSSLVFTVETMQEATKLLVCLLQYVFLYF